MNLNMETPMWEKLLSKEDKKQALIDIIMNENCNNITLNPTADDMSDPIICYAILLNWDNTHGEDFFDYKETHFYLAKFLGFMIKQGECTKEIAASILYDDLFESQYLCESFTEIYEKYDELYEESIKDKENKINKSSYIMSKIYQIFADYNCAHPGAYNKFLSICLDRDNPFNTWQSKFEITFKDYLYAKERYEELKNTNLLKEINMGE